MHIIPAPDLNIVRQLLQSAGLPIADIGHNPQARFYLIEPDDKTAGGAGVKPTSPVDLFLAMGMARLRPLLMGSVPPPGLGYSL